MVGANAANSAAIRDFISDVLQAHRLGIFLVMIPRREIVELLGMDFSQSSKATLNYISTKLSDYEIAANLSRRVLTVCDHSVEPKYQIVGRNVRISSRLLSLERCVTKAFFLAENLTDIRLIRVLCDTIFKIEPYPSDLICFRPVLGGGSTVADALENEDPVPQKGIVLCDRDKEADVPPFAAGTTGEIAHRRAITLALLSGPLGWSDISPMFGFAATWGRTLENYVGPNLLDYYFSVSTSRNQRKLLTDAFPKFPNLSAEEWWFWCILNLKDGTKPPTLAKVLDEFKTRFGIPPKAQLPFLKYYGAVKIPGDTIDWVVNNAADSVHSKKIAQAIERDLRHPEYFEGIRLLATLLREVAAGDRRAIYL